MKKVWQVILKILSAVAAVALIVWLFLIFWSDPLFGPEEDVALGRQSAMSIEQEGESGPVLDRDEYHEAYAHIDRLVAHLVESPEVKYRDIFAYDDVKIIHNDSILNAFATPGGFIYVYTGLIRYLEAEDHLAGVLGHEIAHAELRHSSVRLQKQFGSNRLFEFIVLTTPISARGAISLSILQELTSLDYSRDQEAEADAYSVRYLSTTDYACDATAGFFEKLMSEQDAQEPPAFLSDHPPSTSRIQDIKALAAEVGCSTELGDQRFWRRLQESLPPVQSTGSS